MLRMCCRASIAMLAALVMASAICAQPNPSANPNAVAARVNGRELTVGDVEYQLQLALGEVTVDPATEPRLRYETLKKLVDRELVLLMLEKRNLAATPQDVELALTRLTEELMARGRTLEEYLQQQEVSEQQFRRTLRWTISWKRMLDEFMTDANLERYYQANRRQFDGTKLHVAHILLKSTPDERDAVLEKARQIREEITSGRASFAEAARKYSQAPTAEQGGDVGWIERHAPMPEAFSAAAFELDPQQISEPVESPFGVHLVQCLELEAGDRQWQDVRRELEAAVAQYLFNWAAERERPTARIEMLDTIPSP